MNLFSTIKRNKISFMLILFLSSYMFGQEVINSTPADQRLKMYDNHVSLVQQSPFNNFKWQYIGPTAMSGRMTSVAVTTPRGKNYSIYVTAATGGVWKTTNDGTTWEPIFENGPSTSFGAIALAPSNQNIIWIGTGEANIFRSSNAGIGVYKSEDAGKTWKYMGLGNTGTIPRIVVDPKNPNIVYVAASGHEWTDNEDRGLYKTTDGGKTWKKVFYKDEKTGVIDLVIDPKDPDVLYLSTWQRVRKKWNDPRNESDYTGSSIYKSDDEGKTWKEITNGLPEAKFRGRTGIDVARSNTNVLYAFIDNYDLVKTDSAGNDAYGRPSKGKIEGAMVFRSDNKGKTWKRVSEESEFMQGVCATYGWVFGQMRVDPNDENRVFIMGLSLNISTDGGKTFKVLGNFHSDNHGLWIDPANSNFMVNVNDGGFVMTYDGGKNWKEFTNNIPVEQLFNIAADMGDPIHVYCSIQDHGSYRGIIDLSRGRDKIRVQAFERAPGWEGSIHQIDPTNPDIVYAASFYGSLSRTNMKTNESKNIMPKAEKGEPPLRGQWLAPHLISPHNTKTLYMGFQYVFKSTDRGDTWTKISPDLTYNDPKKIGDIPYQTIFTLSESPIKPGLIYVGTDDGRVHVTKDDGKNWKEIVKGLPYGKWISRIIASKYDPNIVYMSQNGKRDDDFLPYLWKSTDCGETWHSIVNNLPTGPINVIKEDPIHPNILYVGNDFGVYISFNGGAKWHSLQANLPTTYVHDLVVHPRENLLIIATHGRGAWVMDIEPIQKLTENDFSVETFFLNVTAGQVPADARNRWARPMPTKFAFYVKSKTDLNAEVYDMDNKKVKDISIKAGAGFNFAEWDLTTNAKEKTYAAPGKYKIALSVNGTIVTSEVVIKKMAANAINYDDEEANMERERELERD